MERCRADSRGWPLRTFNGVNICFFTYTFLPTIGGAELLLHRLAQSLTQRGHGVTVIAPTVRKKNNSVASEYRIRRYSRPSSKRFGVRQTLVHLTWEYCRRRFSVLHCHGAYPAAYVGAAFKSIFKTPIVVRPHGADMLPGEWIRQNPKLERRMKDSLTAADAIVAQGESLKAELLAVGVDEAKLRIIRNGVVRPPLRPKENSDGEPHLFSMGSMSGKKGYDILFHALAILAPQFPHLRLHLAGSGSRYLELVDLAARLSITDRIRWLGEVNESRKEELLAGNAVYVCPSRREPFSNALLEAMAGGLPIVATHVGGNVEMLQDARDALLVPPEDPGAIALAIKRLLEDSDMRRNLGNAAYERSEQFDWERMVDQYEKLYADLAARG